MKIIELLSTVVINAVVFVDLPYMEYLRVHVMKHYAQEGKRWLDYEVDVDRTQAYNHGVLEIYLALYTALLALYRIWDRGKV